jgi:hypothetical protein
MTYASATRVRGRHARAHVATNRSVPLKQWLLACVAVCLAALGAAPAAQAQTRALSGTPPETVIFESRPPGYVGGGLSVTGQSVNGHTFRVTERTQVTRVGAFLHSFAPGSVYMALHRVDTPVSTLDAANESDLVATAVLELPGGDPVEISAPMDATLEPGWYAVVVGTGRHGATLPEFNATVPNTGTVGTPQTWGPYSVRRDGNQMVLQAATTRYLVLGYALPPEPPPATDFLFETVRPHAWWGSGLMELDTYIGTRFTIDRPTRIDRVSTWMGYGSGSVFAAILPLPSATAYPPEPQSPAFEASMIASAVIDIGHPVEEYGADFGGLMLAPGHYALVFGANRFGASGMGSLITVDDSIAHPDTIHYLDAGGFWFTDPQYHYSMRLTGIVPEWRVAPEAVDFGELPLGAGASRTVTLTNLRDAAPLAITGIAIEGGGAHFTLDDDAAACGATPIAPDASCSFTVHYQADAIGSHVASLRIDADAVPSFMTVVLAGQAVPSALVTPSVVGNGGIDPDLPQRVAIGATTTFTLMPAPGHHLAGVGGSCGGSLDGLGYTTAPVAADCTVQANFAIDTFTVTASADGNGSISPAGTQTVEWNQVATFVLAPSAGHHLADIASTCGGTLDGLVFTTGPVTADCSVHASFAIDTFTVIASAGANGSISPSGAVTVEWNQPGTFVLAPDAGHHIEGVDSTCGGSLDGASFTTAPVTGDCSVQARFAIDPATTVVVVSGTGQETTVGTAFAAPLVVRVSNDAGVPVPDVTVTFLAPSQGASAAVTASAISDAQGLASVEATANTISGSYTIQARAEGLAGSADFALANRAAAPDALSVVSGSGQTALVGSTFAAPLVVRVRDGYGNAVEGASVVFASPSTGAGATVTPSAASSDADGIVSVEATANATPGSYDVSATVAGVAAPAAFVLENLAPALALSVDIDDGCDHVAYGALAEYLVTVRNDGSDAADGTQVLVALPEQLDGEAAEWHCLDLASGCTPAGAGALADAMRVAPEGVVRYVLAAPVRGDAAGDRVEIEALAESTYHEPVDGHDANWLVLFRDGFGEAGEEDAAEDMASAIVSDGGR